MKQLICVLLVLVCLSTQVFSDDYGHGGGHTQVHMVPSNGKGGKWRIRAKGKGMQHLMTHHGGGGGHGGGHGGGGGHHTQVVYVPVPYGHGGGHGGHSYDHHMSYGHGYDHGGYDHGGYDHGGHDHGGHGGYSHDNEVSIIPIYGGHGGYGHDYGYGGYMKR